MDSDSDLTSCASAVQIFVQRNLRWPSELSSEPQEVQMARWLEVWRERLTSGQMGALDHARLSSTIPGWRVNGEQQWLLTARKLSNVVLSGGFEAVAADHPFLNGWMNGQATLSRLGSLDPLRATWLHKHVPGWLTESRGKPLIDQAKTQPN